MAHFDLPLDALRGYEPQIAIPADFDAFWRETLDQTRAAPLDATFVDVSDSAYQLVLVQDVAFCGFGGTRIRGWMILPRDRADAMETDMPSQRGLACLVSFVGYGGGRSLPIDHLAPAVAGLAHFVMDTRGQGAGWSAGDTPDDVGSGPAAAGFLTRGIDSPQTYYYRRVFADAVRAVEAAAAHPLVDSSRIAVGGASQGGAIAIAAAALAPQRVAALVADVPFLCHVRRAATLTDQPPYAELAAYARAQRERVERVFETLGYFDGANLATRISAPSLWSAALMDLICPPSTVFAAYNRVRSAKEMCVYEFNGHEGGGALHAARRLRWLQQQLGAQPPRA
ncbi:MAG: alpha/beta fold hydrolase [Phycisphaerales bacterium]|nr:alpha/beta fold hydrolase [Phycisphaerales bacterium]